jgi:hypothetical protein
MNQGHIKKETGKIFMVKDQSGKLYMDVKIILRFNLRKVI